MITHPVHEQLVPGQNIERHHPLARLDVAPCPQESHPAGFCPALARQHSRQIHASRLVRRTLVGEKAVAHGPFEIEILRHTHGDRTIADHQGVLLEGGRQNQPRPPGDLAERKCQPTTRGTGHRNEDLAARWCINPEGLRPETDEPGSLREQPRLVCPPGERLRGHPVVGRPHRVGRDLEGLDHIGAQAEDDQRSDQKELHVVPDGGLRVNRAPGAAEILLQVFDAQLELFGSRPCFHLRPERGGARLEFGKLRCPQHVSSVVPDLVRDLEPVGRVLAHLAVRRLEESEHTGRYWLLWRTLMNASGGIETFPICFIFFFPSFCLSRSLRLRLMSPP